MMKENPLLKLSMFGQAIWLDYIHRRIINSGELLRLIEEDGLCGVTSNPSIFDKAIAGSHEYDNAIRALAFEDKSTEAIYLALTLDDVRRSADLFRSTYDRLQGKDGYVSLEVNPHLAHDLPGTVAEAHGLWAALDRPNVFIKVPATEEGLPAIRQLTSEGVNVNVTLLFGLDRYRKVAEAYIAGLEDRAARGRAIHGVASVASFFLSRIDVLVDPLLEEIMDKGGAEAAIAAGLHGQIAIACARVAYRIYKQIFGSDRFRKLAAQGARPQRVLWASTGTKNPAYPDVKYVEALIGPETINTLPPETLNAYRDHGSPAPRLEENVEEAEGFLRSLTRLGIDLEEITRQLEDQGVEQFNNSYDGLLRTLSKKRMAMLEESVSR